MILVSTPMFLYVADTMAVSKMIFLVAKQPEFKMADIFATYFFTNTLSKRLKINFKIYVTQKLLSLFFPGLVHMIAKNCPHYPI